MGRWFKDEDGVMTYSLYRLKFYETEHEIYGEEYGKKLHGKEVDKIFNKLKRHYKIPHWLQRTKRWNGSCNRYKINLPLITSFGMLCHEVAHAVDIEKRGKSKHDKKFSKVFARVINYCRKKNFWENELKQKELIIC